MIGLSGYARAGKDSVAAILEVNGYERRSFAAGLKDALLALNPIICPASGAYLSQVVRSPEDWERAKDHYPLTRSLLQRMGTEVGRAFFGENVWVDLAMRDAPTLSVFSDCRFPNEAEAIRAAGGQVWRVVRPGCGPVNGHASETALDGWDFDRVIHNYGTLETLRGVVREALLSDVTWRCCSAL